MALSSDQTLHMVQEAKSILTQILAFTSTYAQADAAAVLGPVLSPAERGLFAGLYTYAHASLGVTSPAASGVPV